MSDAGTASRTPERSRTGRPAAVVAVAVVCFVEAGFCGVGMLVGIVIAVLGAEARGAGAGSGLLLTVGLLIAAACLLAGVLYVLGGRGLLRGRRAWYLAVLTLLVVSVVAWTLGFAVQRNPWYLLWPAVDVVSLALLAAAPQSRVYFLGPRP